MSVPPWHKTLGPGLFFKKGMEYEGYFFASSDKARVLADKLKPRGEGDRKYDTLLENMFWFSMQISQRYVQAVLHDTVSN